jgi:hypothetical protein
MTIFNKDKYIERLVKNATLGMPVKMDLATALGQTPLEVHGSLYLENDVLKLHEKFIPLSSSYTQSGSAGAPVKDTGDLTNSGVTTRENQTNTDTVET